MGAVRGLSHLLPLILVMQVACSKAPSQRAVVVRWGPISRMAVPPPWQWETCGYDGDRGSLTRPGREGADAIVILRKNLGAVPPDSLASAIRKTPPETVVYGGITFRRWTTPGQSCAWYSPGLRLLIFHVGTDNAREELERIVAGATWVNPG